MKIVKYLLCAALLFTTLSSFAGWVSASNGYIPRGAWAIGHEEDGTPLYLCRANFRGLHPGKLRRDFGGCDISFAGKEITVRNYSVYVGRPPFIGGPVIGGPGQRFNEMRGQMDMDEE